MGTTTASTQGTPSAAAHNLKTGAWVEPLHSVASVRGIVSNEQAGIVQAAIECIGEEG